MGNFYVGELKLPEDVVITRERGCQFASEVLTRRAIRCGQTANLTQTEADGCRACINFYYVHQEDVVPRERSVYASFETF